jgi:predicted secreted protein
MFRKSAAAHVWSVNLDLNSIAGFWQRSLANRRTGFSHPRLEKRAWISTVLGALFPRLLLALICGISCSHGAETVIVNKKFHNREIKVRVGSTIQLELEELATAGYAWTIQNLDTAHFEVLKVQTKSTPSKGDLAGASIVKTWQIRPIKQGQSELKLLHHRVWEDEKAASDAFVLKVRIIP